MLPRDVGRTILGPFAPQESVDALNERLGTNRPLLVRYAESIAGIVTLDFGESFVSGQPVLPQILGGGRALGQACRPGPAHHHPDRPSRPGCTPRGDVTGRSDRAIVLLGVTSSSIPEFITATILVVVVGVQLGWLPVLATPPPDADVLTQIRYLLMPAIAMAIVYFGYIARMTRAGTIDVLQSDYTRTATMKGLTTSQTMRRHVIRNALVPTVAVIAVQIGYLFGGIIAVEKIFNYNGMGATMLFAAQRKDLPMLTAGVIVIGIVYMLATLTADLHHGLDEPAHPTGRERLMVDVIVNPDAHRRRWPRRQPPSASQARRETLRLLLRRPAFIIGNVIIIVLDHLRRPRPADHAVRPVQRLLGRPSAAQPGASGSARTGSGATSSRG